MNTDNLFSRCLVLLLSLFVMALGVALSVKADLGVSPVSCVPYVYSLRFPFTMGEATIALNCLLILSQMAVLGRAYKPIQLLQLPVILVFGCFTDVALFLLRGVHPSGYAAHLVLCLLSCVVIGFGVFLEVRAKVTYMGGEGLALAISERFHIEFGKTKIGMDCSMVLLCIVSSFVLLGHLTAVREGTVVAAISVGYLARFFGRKVHFFDVLTEPRQREKEAVAEKRETAAEKRLVITISREFGSGGRDIGRLLAQKLGLSFYDKELVRLTAEKSGFTTDYIVKHEQRLASSLLFSLYRQNYAYVDEKMPPLDVLFLVQSKVIRDIGTRESCVIVGRCAGFVLKNVPGCFNVFIHADKAFRRERYVRVYGGKPDTADRELDRIDRDRANYCRHFTGHDRDDADGYNLTLDSSRLGIERSAELIADAVRLFAASDKLPERSKH